MSEGPAQGHSSEELVLDGAVAPGGAACVTESEESGQYYRAGPIGQRQHLGHVVVGSQSILHVGDTRSTTRPSRSEQRIKIPMVDREHDAGRDGQVLAEREVVIESDLHPDSAIGDVYVLGEEE